VNPGAEFKPFAAVTGQSHLVRTIPEGSTADLLQIWAENATGGSVRIHSPRMHDNVQGIRLRVPAANGELLLPYAVKEGLYNQDSLEVEGTGGAGETDTIYYLNHYSQLSGAEGTFRSWAEVEPRVEKYMGVEVPLKTGAVTGEWGVPKAINSAMDQFDRPYEYAILGYIMDVAVGALAFRGTNVGEIRCGGPGVLKPDLTQEWFIRLSEESGMPAIPCFMSGNAGSVLVEACQSAAEAARNPTVLLAKLR
jgi:hypothetical protein